MPENCIQLELLTELRPLKNIARGNANKRKRRQRACVRPVNHLPDLHCSSFSRTVLALTAQVLLYSLNRAFIPPVSGDAR